MKLLVSLIAALSAAVAVGCASSNSRPLIENPTKIPSPDKRFSIGALLYADDFSGSLDNWMIELEHGGNVIARDGALDVDVPAGCTIWFKHPLAGPVFIQYRATAIKAGGPNDRVSDLNCFWMARDIRNRDNLLSVHRSGNFANYNLLQTYYVGLGGNTNTTTRFRRYVGDAVDRPLLPQNDLRNPADMLQPNQPQLIGLVADGSLIQFYRNGKRLFEMNDPHPYTSGYFAFRTTKSHLRLQDFRVYRILPQQHD